MLTEFVSFTSFDREMTKIKLTLPSKEAAAAARLAAPLDLSLGSDLSLPPLLSSDFSLTRDLPLALLLSSDLSLSSDRSRPLLRSSDFSLGNDRSLPRVSSLSLGSDLSRPRVKVLSLGKDLSLPRVNVLSLGRDLSLPRVNVLSLGNDLSRPRLSPRLTSAAFLLLPSMALAGLPLLRLLRVRSVPLVATLCAAEYAEAAAETLWCCLPPSSFADDRRRSRERAGPGVPLLLALTTLLSPATLRSPATLLSPRLTGPRLTLLAPALARLALLSLDRARDSAASSTALVCL